MVLKRNGLKFILPFLLLAGMMLHSCTDEGIVDAPAWHQAVEQGDNAIMRAAKAMVESTQGEMSMPDMVKTLGKAQTRAAGAAPQTLAAGSFTIDWDAAQSLHEEDGTVLLVPIKMKQNMAIWRFTVINNKRKAEQTPMHSVLYVKKFNRTGNIMGRVLSYAPSRQYIKRHPKYKNKIEWYNPDHTDYSGLLLISSLKGTLFHGFNYENGRRQFMFRPNTHAHEHSHGHESAPVTRTLALPDSCQYNHATAPQTETIHSTVFNMRMISSASAINTYSLNNETSGQIYCSFCGKLVDDCECLIVDGDVCDDCGKVIENCICPCPFCDLYPCGCGNGNCLFCNKPLHECECGDTVGGGDGNNNSSNNGNNNNQNQGGNSPGSGSTSTSSPVKHTPSPTDKMIKDAPLVIKKQTGNTCVPTILAFAYSKLYGGKKNTDCFMYDYIMTYRISDPFFVINYGVHTDSVKSFTESYFNTVPFESHKKAIDNGYPIMVNYLTEDSLKHNVLIIGYRNNGDLIYIDSNKGYTMTADSSYLSTGDYKIVITGTKH